MISVTRAWLAFAAIGAGMIHLALVVSSPLPFAIAPALLGLAELGWGVAVLARSAVPRPLVALFPALAAREAGRHARPHGEHVLPAPQNPSQHAPANGHEGR